MTSLRDTRAARAIRQAHHDGAPVLVLAELAVSFAAAAAVAVAAIEGGPAALAAAIGVAFLGALTLMVVATVVVPDDAPPAPSWFARQRPAKRPRSPSATPARSEL